MSSTQLTFVNLLELKDGSLAKYEGTEGSGASEKVKIRRVLIRLASVRLGKLETVAVGDIQ
jgi:hypothetical protein